MKKIVVLMFLVAAFALAGCGSKKNKAKNADDAEATDIEPEADTGPVEYPEPPANSATRNPNRFKVSVRKAYVLPLAADGRCFDECHKDIKALYVENLPSLSGEQFGSAAKALATTVGAKGGLESLPDLYVHIDCGSGQELTTHKTSAQNQLTARWRGAEENLNLDVNDQCAISVWDADDDNQDELIGDTVANLISLAKGGVVTISSEDAEFGQVYMVELYLEQLDGTPVIGGAPAAGGQTGSGGSTAGGTTGSGGTGSSGGSTPASGSGAYQVEIVKVNLKEKKKDGQPWDTKVPFVGSASDVIPDPFVSAFVNGYQSAQPFMKTEPANNTLYAEFGTTGSVDLQPGDKIHFMVWDKDKLDHDLAGECISDSVGSLSLGQEITIRDCGQVDFVVFKISR